MSVPTVQRWVDLGHLKAWKTVGGHRRIDADSAESFIRSHAQRGGDDAVAPFSALVIDADPHDRDRLCALMDIAVPGARITCEGNGFDALIEIGRAMPDLIVVDLALAHLDGVAMVRHLCTRGDARPPAIVGVSTQIERPAGLPPGVALLARPLERTRFVETINQALDVS